MAEQKRKRSARGAAQLLGDHFPTEFAKSIAESVALLEWERMIEEHVYFDYCASTCENNHAEAYWFERSLDALRDFQRMSMGCPFEKCILAYHGFNVTEVQTKALRVIHEATPSFLLGRTLDNAVARMDRDKTSNKDFGHMLQVVVDQVTLLNNLGSATTSSTESIKKLVVNVQAEIADKLGEDPGGE